MTTRDATVHVAITGTLSRPRHEIVALIESKTNARFSEHVTYETNYLVASRFDTIKARRAAKLGVKVVTERDMMGCIEPTPLPVKPPLNWHPVDLDAIEYETIEQFAQPRVYYLKYKNSGGEESERFILAMERVKSGSHEYLAGYDHDCYKTFRLDRIEKMEDLGTVDAADAGRAR
jgi:hypothetical protein